MAACMDTFLKNFMKMASKPPYSAWDTVDIDEVVVEIDVSVASNSMLVRCLLRDFIRRLRIKHHDIEPR
jgi:hypothetical protein